jgi:hypothetical protein
MTQECNRDNHFGKYSPWGYIQDVEKIADGIWSVSTAGHGGIKLDRKHNAAMPDYMRSPGGWYEEDCQWALVALVFPAAFVAKMHKDGTSDYDHALQAAEHWYPAEFKRFFYGR